MAPNLKGKHVLVLGLGIHGGGVAVTRWLVKQGAAVTVSDIQSSRQLKPSLRKLIGLPVTYHLGAKPATQLMVGCDFIVQNPAVPGELPFIKLARKRGIPIENEASLFLKFCPSSFVIGITGSKGKSTTTSLVGSILKRKYKDTIVAGNIRDTVMFDALPHVKSNTPVVLELSSWHLEIVGQQKIRLPISIITNVTPEHLNRYKSFNDYARAKKQIISHQGASDIAILNYDNPVTRKFGSGVKSQVYWFSGVKQVPRGAYLKGGYVWWSDKGTIKKIFPRSIIGLPGAHNLQNVLAATVAAIIAVVDLPRIRGAVHSFKGLHDRLEEIKKINGVSYINDTASTAPQAACAALKALSPKPIVIIAGGVDKKLNYQEMAQSIRKYAQTAVLLPGTATAKLQHELGSYKPQVLVNTMAQAVKLASKFVPRGGVVLLSPGAASFNLFKHEFHRGQEFRRAVNKL